MQGFFHYSHTLSLSLLFFSYLAILYWAFFRVFFHDSAIMLSSSNISESKRE